MNTLFIILLTLVAVFLILVILVQRGRGGGLTGALGGMGGQSAFGSKAGDTFTKVTMWTALVWILMCVFVVKYLGGGPKVDAFGPTSDGTTQTTTEPGTGAGPTDGTRSVPPASQPKGKAEAENPGKPAAGTPTAPTGTPAAPKTGTAGPTSTKPMESKAGPTEPKTGPAESKTPPAAPSDKK